MYDLANALRVLPGMLAILLTGLAIGCTVEPASIDVEGRLEGQAPDGTAATPIVQQLRHAQGVDTLARVDYRPSGGGIQRLQSVHVRAVASTGLPFEEEFFYVSLSQPGASDRQIESDEPGWVRNHLGGLVILSLRKDDVTLPENDFDDFPPASPRPAGASWLARVENDDRRLPWRVLEGETGCTAEMSLPFDLPLAATLVAPPPEQAADCFDLESLTAILLANFAREVTVGVAQEDLPSLASVALTNHRMAIVPHLVLGLQDVPGFAFVYAVDLRVRVAGLPAAAATAFVPVAFNFRTNAALTNYELAITPMTERVAITYEGVLGGAVVEDLRDGIVEAVEDFELPEFVGFSLEEVLQQLILQVLTARHPGLVALPPDYNVIALPEERVTAGKLAANVVAEIPVVTTTVVPAPGNTVGVTGDDDGRVTIVEVVDPPVGAVVRVTTLEAIKSLRAFRLLFLE